MRTRQGRLAGLAAVSALTVGGAVSSCDRSTTAPTQVRAEATLPEASGPLVIYLHYDYMVSTDPTNPHSDGPHQESIDTVVAAFARRGIRLIIDPQHTVIPHVSYMAFTEDAYSCARLRGGENDAAIFTRLKAQYFHPEGNQPWHYAIFGHGGLLPSAYPDCPLSSGEAELPGYNFAVTLGLAFHFAPGNEFWGCSQDWENYLGKGFCTRMEAGTLMHELGHNLDLHHGGADDENYKPNYLSIMNYRFQGGGLRFAAAPGGTVPVKFGVDYSDLELPTLDENHLDERVGLGGPTNDVLVSAFSECMCPSTSIPSTGPIDWNRNGVIEPDVQVDVNGLYDGGGYFSSLRGFDDWEHVRAYLLGGIQLGPTTIAREDAAEQPYVTGIAPTTGPANGGTAVTINGTHLGKVTEVLFGVAGPAATFRIVNVNTIVAVSPPYPYRYGGPIDVTVVSGQNSSPGIDPDVFTYQPWVGPVVEHISPQAGPASGGTPITISGRHLTAATGVSFGSTPATSFTVLDDSTIRAVAPVGNFNYTYSVDVIVTNPAGTSARGIAFTYVARPVVYGISPSSGTDAGGTVVMIKVSDNDYLAGVTGVSFGAVLARDFTQPTYSFPSGYTLLATSPAPEASTCRSRTPEARAPPLMRTSLPMCRCRRSQVSALPPGKPAAW